MAARFAPAEVNVDRRADGSIVLRSPRALPTPTRAVGDWLVEWAKHAPSRPFLGERADEGWRVTSYAETLHAVRALAHALLDLGASRERPVMLLSDNSIDHALVQLAAMHVGVPAAPISPAYSLMSKDHQKLRAVTELVDPAVIFASDSSLFSRAIDAIGARGAEVISSHDVTRMREKSTPGGDVDRAFERIGPETIAKILFTSGSTGAPKGVVNTQRMLTSNQAMIGEVWPFLRDRPPVIVDWLPWSHTFGGNHNFHMILANGGTLWIDDGRPTPQLVTKSIRNLKEKSPTLAFNVPRGFDVLVAHLEEDEELRAAFFRDLDVVFYAAAALTPTTWRRLENVAKMAGKKPAMVSAWGSTETSPLVTSVHFPIDRAGVIGLPAPGCALKLAPVDANKLEMRVKGPNVTPGYWRSGGGIDPITLDDEDFLPMGDAGRLEDESAPHKGVVFDGRTSENFKLSSGTWVSVGALRVAIVAACVPLVADAIVCGHDRDEIGVLLVPAPATNADDASVRAKIAASLAAHAESHPSSSTRVARALFLREPLSIDAGEITDKGYVNQRAVLARRAAEVDRLYSSAPEVVLASREN